MSTTVQVRIEQSVKTKAVKILEEMGLDLSSAIKLFLVQVIRSKSFPLEIRTVNGYTPAQEKRMIKETEWAEKHGKRFKTAKEALEYLRS